MKSPDERELTEEELQDAFLAYTQAKGSNWWSGFQPRHLKLHLLKGILNYTAPRILKLIEPRDKIYHKTPLLLDQMFERIQKKMKAEQRVNKAVADKNFMRLVEAARRALVYIADEDPYYRDWVAMALMVVYQSMQREIELWDPHSDPRLEALGIIEKTLAMPNGKEMLFYFGLRYKLPMENGE